MAFWIKFLTLALCHETDQAYLNPAHLDLTLQIMTSSSGLWPHPPVNDLILWVRTLILQWITSSSPPLLYCLILYWMTSFSEWMTSSSSEWPHPLSEWPHPPPHNYTASSACKTLFSVWITSSSAYPQLNNLILIQGGHRRGIQGTCKMNYLILYPP